MGWSIRGDGRQRADGSRSSQAAALVRADPKARIDEQLGLGYPADADTFKRHRLTYGPSLVAQHARMPTHTHSEARAGRDATDTHGPYRRPEALSRIVAVLVRANENGPQSTGQPDPIPRRPCAGRPSAERNAQASDHARQAASATAQRRHHRPARDPAAPRFRHAGNRAPH